MTIPTEFMLPWDDPEIDRHHGFAVFDVFASEEKTLLAFPGSHSPFPTERIDTRLFARHLAKPAPTEATTTSGPQAGGRPGRVAAPS